MTRFPSLIAGLPAFDGPFDAHRLRAERRGRALRVLPGGH